MSLLSARALTASIGNKLICNELNFSVEPDQYWGVLGGNGVGKTTLLQTLIGLHEAVHGDIEIEGKSLQDWRRKDLACRLGVLFQDGQDTFPASVMETVLAGRHPYLPFWSIEGKDDIKLAHKALADVAMVDMSYRQVNTLSGGERRRLAIATLLVQNPTIWLLDEPTNHLDLYHQISLLDLVIERVRSTTGGILMVLHDVNIVTRYCTHAMLMIDANTILCGPVDAVVTQKNLEKLYQHPIKTIQDKNAVFYFPE